MKLRYYVEFKFMPEWLFSNPAEFVQNVLADRVHGMTRIYDSICAKKGLENRYGDDDFEMMAQTLADGNKMFRICMPQKGIEAPFCTDVFIGYCVSTAKYRYLTVEYEDENTNFLGEVLPDGSHVSYGPAPSEESELVKEVKRIFYEQNEKDNDGPAVVHMNPNDMHIRNVVEYLLLPDRFYNDRQNMMQDFSDINTRVITLAYQYAAEKMGVECPYEDEDFQFNMIDVDSENGRFLVVISMPRSGMQAGDALQVVMAMDYPNDNMKYFILEFSGSSQLYLCEVLPTEDISYIRHGALPKNPNDILPVIAEIAFK